MSLQISLCDIYKIESKYHRGVQQTTTSSSSRFLGNSCGIKQMHGKMYTPSTQYPLFFLLQQSFLHLPFIWNIQAISSWNIDMVIFHICHPGVQGEINTEMNNQDAGTCTWWSKLKTYQAALDKWHFGVGPSKIYQTWNLLWICHQTCVKLAPVRKPGSVLLRQLLV